MTFQLTSRAPDGDEVVLSDGDAARAPRPQAESVVEAEKAEFADLAEPESIEPEPTGDKPNRPPGGTRRMITAFLIVALILAAVVALSLDGARHHRGLNVVRTPAPSSAVVPGSPT